MLKTLLPGTLMLALSAPVAVAQEWSGAYFGAVFGLGEGKSSHLNQDSETLAPDISGQGFGVTYGRNFGSAGGRLVLGYEVDAMWADIAGKTAVGRVHEFNCGSNNGCHTDLSWFASLRGRVGVANGSTLVYGTAGVAAGGVEGSIPGYDGLNEGAKTANGWTAGIGVEHLISDRLSLKGEVLYTDLGRSRYDGFGPGDPANRYFVDVEVTQFRFGLNHRF